METYTTPAIKCGPLEEDIMHAPHALIAGTTGSGKSVLLRRCLLYAANQDYKTMLIDPKDRELVQWKDAVNTWGYAHRPQEIVALLHECILMMESRLASMKGWERDYAGDPVWIIIDEWSDICDNAPEAAKLVKMLAQKGRAAGMHVLLCTQHPSAEIINGSIKANFPVRCALHVANGTYSRMIIERKGAELLPYRGYAMLMHESGDVELYETKDLPLEEEKRVCEYMISCNPRLNPVPASSAPEKKKGFFGRIFAGREK